MNKGIIKMFNDLFSTALILGESPQNICWDIAHYIADNAIAKIMMLKLVENGEAQKIIEKLRFPDLITSFQSKFPSINLDYPEILNQHANGRNPFQHHLETTILGIRQEQASEYLSICQDLMKNLGIYKPDPKFSLKN